MDLKLGDSLHPIELIVFDCDGVLLDTMPRKIEAFRRWVPEEHAGRREDFMRYVMTGFGKSRAYHVRHFYESMLGQTVDQDFLEAEIQRFTDICEPLCANADWRPGSKEFVTHCQGAGVPRYVLSGTPQQALEDMLSSADADGLFDVIIGSPPAKPESLERILRETGTQPGRCVFIGDANADQEAALHVGAHFVYFPSEADPPEAPVTTRVRDLRDLMPSED